MELKWEKKREEERVREKVLLMCGQLHARMFNVCKASKMKLFYLLIFWLVAQAASFEIVLSDWPIC